MSADSIPYTLARVCEGQGGWAALLTCDICGATVTEDAYNTVSHPAVDKHTAWHENESVGPEGATEANRVEGSIGTTSPADSIIERVAKVIASVLADNREVNGGELESVLSIYTPEGIAILCRNALAAEGLTRLIRLGEAVERQRPMTLTSYSEGWNRCLDRIYHDAGTDPR